MLTQQEQDLLALANRHATNCKALEQQMMSLRAALYQEQQLAAKFQFEANNLITERLEVTLKTRSPSKRAKREHSEGSSTNLSNKALEKLAFLLE